MELAAQLDRFLAENVKGISIDAQAVLAHVIRPPNFADASPDGPQPNQPRPPGLPPPEIPYHLDVSAFEAALDNALKDAVAGYVAQLRQSGQILFTKARQFAIRHFPKADDGERWTADVQMHVASVSKLMTAMAMMVLLRDKKISYDTPIIDYLPDYWVKGSNIDRITFRDLFNHTSGLTANAVVDFTVMKSAIAAGIIVPVRAPLDSDIDVDIFGEYNYQNLNYGLCRILLAIINGNIKKDVNFPLDSALNDAIWDMTTFGAYNTYLQANVFQPSGVRDATLDHPTGCALAYRVPNDRKPGWNSGSMQESCGSDGWHLSVNELLNVMGQFRRGNGILAQGDAQAMLDNGFGVDPLGGDTALPTAFPTLAGNVYCKPGDWHNTATKQDEQSLAFFLPEDMELAVFVNSMVDGQLGTNNFRNLVRLTYQANLLPP